jgi:ethanolamine utilization protein EutA
MHDIEFSHVHVTPEESQHLSETIWSADNVELTTVGIDVGSSTSHLMFARVHLQRLSTGLSSRFVVAERQVLWRSPILLTPYRADGSIDADGLGAFVEQGYEQAGLGRGQVDSGAVILTGEALKRDNARAIADRFAETGGGLVCATAGHHLEAALAAHGSGAVALSRQEDKTILNVDIGGGTTKFALVQGGAILATAAVAVGGRLLVHGPDGLISRCDEPILRLADSLAMDLEPGAPVSAEQRGRLAREMARIIVAMLRQDGAKGLAGELLVTEPLPAAPKPDAITFSGGVAEYLFGRETGDFGDLGRDLAHQIGHALARGEAPAPVWDPGHGIRATAIGAAQFTVEVSGNTIHVSEPGLLPLRNVPVLSCGFDLGSEIDWGSEIDRGSVAEEVRRALERHGLDDRDSTVALAIAWQGEPSHGRLRALAEGISAGLPATVARGGPIVLLVDADIAMTIGRLFREEIAGHCHVVAVDGVQLKDFDFVDIGAVIRPTNVVPVVIKSLLF